jgi:hypothetical protein
MGNGWETASRKPPIQSKTSNKKLPFSYLFCCIFSPGSLANTFVTGKCRGFRIPVPTEDMGPVIDLLLFKMLSLYFMDSNFPHIEK